MNGNKTLILGNHDKRRWYEDKKIFNAIYDLHSIHVTGTYGDAVLKDKLIVLCHYPIASWASKGWGSWHLYGHCHGNFENHGLSMDIGVDANNYLPVSIEEVFLRMKQKKEKE